MDRQGKHVKHITQRNARKERDSRAAYLPPTEGTQIPSLYTPYACTLTKLKTRDTLFRFSSNIQSTVTHLDHSPLWMTRITEGNFLHLVRSKILMKTTLWYDTV